MVKFINGQLFNITFKRRIFCFIVLISVASKSALYSCIYVQSFAFMILSSRVFNNVSVKVKQCQVNKEQCQVNRTRQKPSISGKHFFQVRPLKGAPREFFDNLENNLYGHKMCMYHIQNHKDTVQITTRLTTKSCRANKLEENDASTRCKNFLNYFLFQ